MEQIKTNIQKRVAFQPTGLVMREGADKPMIDGVAIVVNQETVLWEGSDWREIEVVDPSCIAEEFIREQDIKLNLLHERTLSFARCNKGAGMLVLETREDGLHFAAPGDDSSIARQASDLIANGTYTGCSFEFWAKDYEVSEREGKDGKKEYVIRHKAFERIGAITIGMDPAYEQTSVGLREVYREQSGEPSEEERQAQLAEEAAKAEREKQEREEQAKREEFTRARSLSAMQKELEIMELQMK